MISIDEWVVTVSGAGNGGHKTLEVAFPFYEGDYTILKELGVEDADEVTDILRDMRIDKVCAFGKEWDGNDSFVRGYDIFELQDMWEEYDNMDGTQQEVVEYIVDNYISGDLYDAVYYENRLDVSVYPKMDLEDVAIELYEDGVFGECSESLKPYIDFKALGDDLKDMGYEELDTCVVCFPY